jgi:hypothetical protein
MGSGGFAWCADRMADDDVLTQVVPLKSSLGDWQLWSWSSYRDVQARSPGATESGRERMCAMQRPGSPEERRRGEPLLVSLVRE